MAPVTTGDRSSHGATLLDESIIRSTLDAALRRGGSFAEIFVEDRRSSSAYLDDGKVEELTSGHDRGAGVRVVVGETTGFAHTPHLSPEGFNRPTGPDWRRYAAPSEPPRPVRCP